MFACLKGQRPYQKDEGCEQQIAHLEAMLARRRRDRKRGHRVLEAALD
ncbi:MAG: hypothetical protein ACE5OR_01405 [bacterium]